MTHRRRQNFYALPTRQWQLLAKPPFSILHTLEKVDDAIDVNAKIAESILHSALRTFGLDLEPDDPENDWRNTATPSDLDKARSTIRQMYRDWSEEGSCERQIGQKRVLGALERVFGSVEDRSSIRVLVPGAGLGRLVFELCMEGFTVEGNEISYHQLLASNWVLNHTQMFEQYDLYPFALDFSNVPSREHQLKSVRIPDAHAGSELRVPRVTSGVDAAERMSMTAADFVILYNDEAHREAYDAITTVFFIDTAPNFIRYIEAVSNCLKVGGVWVNEGPLLWHFSERRAPAAAPSQDQSKEETHGREKAGIEEPGSFELSNEEVLQLVKAMGFELEDHGILQEGEGYIQNPSSMLQNVYQCSFWVAKKKPPP